VTPETPETESGIKRHFVVLCHKGAWDGNFPLEDPNPKPKLILPETLTGTHAGLITRENGPQGTRTTALTLILPLILICPFGLLY